MSAFFTSPRFCAGLAQYAGAGAWEGCGRWGAEARRRRAEGPGETRTHPTVPVKGTAFQRCAVGNPPLHGEGTGGDGFAPELAVTAATAASARPAHQPAPASTTPATDAPPHAQ